MDCKKTGNNDSKHDKIYAIDRQDNAPLAGGASRLSKEGYKMIKKELLEILCCPADKGEIVEQNGKIVCLKCGRRYPVRDGIPIMLIEEAEEPGH